MKHLSRDYDHRRAQAEAILHPQTWNVEHLKMRADWLWSGFVRNMNGFERTYGEGAYSRLWQAYVYAAWRLEHQGAVHPDDLAIVEAYNAMPYRSGTARDDEIDFDAPRRRLQLALAAPLDVTGTPRDPDWREAA